MPEELPERHPKVGLGVLIQNDNGCVLMGLRKGEHAGGVWSCPGGHLRFGETVFEGAAREAQEEVGLSVGDLELVSISDEMRYIETEDKHYVIVGIRARSFQGVPKTMEPDVFEEWQWFDLDNLPENMLEGSEQMIDSFKNNKIYNP